MSLLDSLRNKKKTLTHCSTTVTKLSGEKVLETTDASGNVRESKLLERHYGFVEDLEPDLQVAEILPFLTLGSQDVAGDLHTIKKYGISHILSIGVKLPEFERLVYKYVDLCDLPNADLLSILTETNTFINSARLTEGKVFAHCNAGCSRAPSVVIGYLMSFMHLSYEEAFLLVGDKRYIRPNEGFVGQLKLYEKKVNDS